MSDHLIVQMPDGAPAQLILLFHGVGSTPDNMRPLGERLAAAFPQAAVINVPGPDACDMGTGLQWFSVRDITEINRAQRVAETMPRFVDCIHNLQKATGTTPTQTALIGFSQGAIMALEATQLAEPLAGRVVALAGRFAQPPEKAPPSTTLHFIHGKSDPVIPYSHTVTAAERLIRLGADVTADVIPFLGHGLSGEVEDLLIERLQTHIPKHLWEQAMQSAPAD
jgi:phospholipase/carboxylesterase